MYYCALEKKNQAQSCFSCRIQAECPVATIELKTNELKTKLYIYRPVEDEDPKLYILGNINAGSIAGHAYYVVNGMFMEVQTQDIVIDERYLYLVN